MVFAARDYFEAGLPPPADTAPPTPGSPLFRYLADRLVDSLDLPWGVARYYELMQLPDEDHFFIRGAARRTVEDEWPRVRSDLAAGRPVPLGLVTVRSADPADLKFNHQVLAYGYDQDGEGTGTLAVRVYDPNRPDDDGARLTVSFGGPGGPTIDYPGGPRVRSFFRTAYTPSDPRAP